MAQRPTYIDLGSGTNAVRSFIPSPAGGMSPRIPHVAGEMPPAMSPLDAFAARSRLLQKQLDNTRGHNGRRVSRLPPIAVTTTLAQPQSAELQSASLESEYAVEEEECGELQEENGNQREVEEPISRPKSHYPHMSMVSQPDIPMPSPSIYDQAFSTPPADSQPVAADDYFGAVRSQSPEPAEPLITPEALPHAVEPTSSSSSRPSYESELEAQIQRGLSIESTSSRGHYPRSLRPPNQYASKPPRSIHSLPTDSSDDENTAYTGSSLSIDRKLSSNSAVSIPLSPISPFIVSHDRPPSVSSTYSMGGIRLSRPAFNFSRPLSHSSRPSMEFPSRQTSSDSHTLSLTDQSVHTPLSMENDEFFDSRRAQTSPAQSYIYTKFTLPRGRSLERRTHLNITTESPMTEWEQPGMSTESSMTEWERQNPQTNVTPATPPPEGNIERRLLTPPQSLRSDDGYTNVSTSDITIADPSGSVPSRPPPVPYDSDRRQSMTSMNSGSTIKAPTRGLAQSKELTAEDHLNKGIDCHERGSLKESTYHLRIAARQDHPTAMLLYALACRHGWGMRANPKEGVSWLRKAMEHADISLDDPTSSTAIAGKDIQEQKTRRAHFALSVYELGVSHMNGWGTEQDKALALQCFEKAADWGDADAMTEAGFCYAQGVGCKKDLKKAAGYYRAAEKKGVSMIGNSW